jgi:hypothetical protein
VRPALPLVLLALAACRDDARTPIERTVDAAYDAYAEVAEAISGAPSCPTGVSRARDVIGRRRGDLAAGLAIQHDPARLTAAAGALAAREDRYREVASRLDAALVRCSGTPGLDEIEAALEPVDGG